MPQARDEFVKAVASETFVIERGFEEVYRTLEARTAPCLDVEVQRTAYAGYVENSSSDYNPALKRRGPDRAEFTLQVVHRPRGVGRTPGPPPARN